MIVDNAHHGIQALGCQLAQLGRQEPIRKLLNEAWAEFWQASVGDVIWEKSEADTLGKLLGGNWRKTAGDHRPAIACT
jgi:hypothetical protein